MKNLSKRSLALVLAMLMMLSMMIVGAVSTNAAEDTIYFVNTENWAKVAAYCYNNVGGNNGDWPGKLATVVDEANGVYSYDAGTYDVIIFNNNNNGKQTANLNTAGNFGKYYEPKTGKFYDSAEEALAAAGSAVSYDYYVAGEDGLCGVGWQPSSPTNGMTKGADGTYTKTYTNVAAGTYEYKVTDGTWTNSWGGDVGNDHNAAVTVDVDGSTVVISFVPNNNPTSKVIAPEVPETTEATEATTEATEATTEATEATTEATEATTVETTEATEPSTTDPVVDTVTLYCECNQAWWNADGAAVGVHYWGGSDTTTYPGVKGTPVDGKDGVWKFEVPADSTGIIFTRMGNSGDQDGKDWGAKTANLTIPTDGTNLYTITSKDPVWGDPGVEGKWSVYGAPVETEYTVVYSYTTNDGEQKLTKTVKTAETDAAAIASLAVPEIVNPYATYDLGECTLDGTTVNAAMVATEKKYTVTVDGVAAGTYGYKEKATVKLNGADYTFYVTGDVDLVSGADKEAAAISLDGLTVSDEKVSMELLATANVENFARMGVVFATSEKSQADIEAAVANVTTGTKVSNGIAVHNSSVDTPNESGSYQFTYAPFVNKDKANKTLYFYTFAVDTNGKVSVSSFVAVDLANAVA